MQLYCIRFSVAIRHGHSMDREKAHRHSIELSAYVEKDTDDFEQFREIERCVNAYFAQYQDQFLNAMPEFRGDASLENMGEVFFAGLTAALRDSNLTLKRLEVGETPLRTYIIGIEDGYDTDITSGDGEETDIALPGMGG